MFLLSNGNEQRADFCSKSSRRGYRTEGTFEVDPGRGEVFFFFTLKCLCCFVCQTEFPGVRGKSSRDLFISFLLRHPISSTLFMLVNLSFLEWQIILVDLTPPSTMLIYGNPFIKPFLFFHSSVFQMVCKLTVTCKHFVFEQGGLGEKSLQPECTHL